MLILLSHRHPQLSDWSLLCLVIWPVLDTLLAVFRRKLISHSLGNADRLHFHQVIMRSCQIFSRGRISKKFANPLASTIILPFVALPATGGVLYADDTKVSFIIVVSATIGFFGAYFYVIRIIKNASKRKAIIAFLGSHI